jgi:ABC-2 type transport system permease protein
MIKIELQGIYAVWLREFTVFKREKSRIISSLVQPLMWIFLFGGGIGGSALRQNSAAGPSYQQYIFPGIIMMSALFSSLFYGLYIVWDRKIDVLKEVLVSPVSRTSIFIGKVLGGCTDVLIQSGMLLIVGYFILSRPGASYFFSALSALGVVFLAVIGTVSVGLALGTFFESMEGFQIVSTFISFPLFFLSGGLFPLDAALRRSKPALYYAGRMDPIAYSVDALRTILLHVSLFGIAKDVAVIGLFAVAMIIIGGRAFNRMKL